MNNCLYNNTELDNNQINSYFEESLKDNNFLRTLTQLNKEFNRLVRQSYDFESKYAKRIKWLKQLLIFVKELFRDKKLLNDIFYIVLSECIKRIVHIIKNLIKKIKPTESRRSNKKQSKIRRSINSMTNAIEGYLKDSKFNQYSYILPAELKEAGALFFKYFFNLRINAIEEPKNTEKRIRRGIQTYIFPWPNPKNYGDLVNDKERFKKEVVDKLFDYKHATGHACTCTNTGKYSLKGFRSDPRKVIFIGKTLECKIRMVKCDCCGKLFSLLPSFISREKHYSIGLIGEAIKGIALGTKSLQDVLDETVLHHNPIKSKQTVLNWLKWIGSIHPADVLSKAGITGSGYFQEDEAFTKEPDLRTYVFTIVDPKTHLVWHMGYLDHVDEKTLCESLEEFLSKISFKVIGVTKDKWAPATKAFKSLNEGIWIGYCHRHCLVNFEKALLKYQIESGCSDTKRKELYEQFSAILNGSTNKVNLEIRVRGLKDEAFNHPLLKKRVDELLENAVHYTSHNKKSGITKTTSIVDNFLKKAKERLNKIRCFRDPEWAKIFYNAMANIRNFVPYKPGAKNAHKSPFMLANGKIFGLHWIEVMNLHNVFI